MTANRKCRDQVILINPEGDMNVFTRFNVNPSNSC